VLGQFHVSSGPVQKRIACTSTSDDFIATAALNADGKIAVVVLNLTDHQSFLRVWLRGKFVKYQCPPNGTITFILQTGVIFRAVVQRGLIFRTSR